MGGQTGLALQCRLSIVMLTIAHGLMYVDLSFQEQPRVIAAAVAQSAGGVVVIDPGPST